MHFKSGQKEYKDIWHRSRNKLDLMHAVYCFRSGLECRAANRTCMRLSRPSAVWLNLIRMKQAGVNEEGGSEMKTVCLTWIGLILFCAVLHGTVTCQCRAGVLLYMPV